MFGIDVSNWQAGLKLASIPGLQFVGIKATGGDRYVDPHCDNFFEQAKALDLPRMFYHFAGDGFPRATAHDEAHHFVKHTRGYFDGLSIPVLDWEAVGSENIPHTRGVRWALAWLMEVERLTGVKPLIYMNTATLLEFDWSSVVANDNGLWIANWNGIRAFSRPPAVSSGQWPFYAVHQYTDSGQLSGWPSGLDLNHTTMNREQWLLYAQANGTADKPVAPPVKPIRTHTVQRGENLSSIAAKYGTTWEKIYAINVAVIGGNPNLVYAGMKLTLP